MAEKKERQLNYELLRILAMLMIVCLHYIGKGGLLGNPARADITAAGYTVWAVEALCLVAVNVYVLLSGYFGVDAPAGRMEGKGVTFWNALQRPLKIWKQVFFYSAAIGCGAVIFGAQEFDIYQMLRYFFPVVTEHYWFASSYIVLCLMMPFLNAGFSKLGRRQVKYLLVGFLLIFCISKTIIPMHLPWDKYGYDCIWFMILYLTGAYLKHYGIRLLKSVWGALALYFGSMSMVFLSFVLIRMFFLKTGKLEDWINYGYTYNYLFCYTGAVGLFLAFSQKKDGSGRISRFLERSRKPVELFSGATFGVYLIHEHVNIRDKWPEWFGCGARQDVSAGVFLLHMLVSVLCVYVVCSLIEIIRQKYSFSVFPAFVLLIYPLRHAATGLDLMDAGYSLGNYRFFGGLDGMWKLATYLSNITGVMLSGLPFGGRWIGMNVYCGLLIGAAAAAVYLYLWKKYGRYRKKDCVLLFVSELTALSLCWAPCVTLYHYLGYLFMTCASVFLYDAVTKNKKGYYVAAGVILGLCVAVRMPNVTYMALILPVWCDCFWKRQAFADKSGNQKEWMKELAKRTLFCAAGYLAGVVVPLGVICVRYGAAAYPRMVSSLFGMTEQASDYKPVSMVTAMFGDYIRYSVWLILFAVYMAAGIIFFRITGRKLSMSVKNTVKRKITYACKALYALGLFVLLRFCYGRGMFDFNYSDYFSMYKWVTVYLLIVAAMCVGFVLKKGVRKDFRLWAVFLLVIICITPLGSNNGLYPIINNLFLVLPVSMLMMAELFRQSRKSVNGFAFRLVSGFVLACVTVQSVLFGLGFIFHDAGAQGSGVRISLQCASTGTGLMTTEEKKTRLSGLDGYLYRNELNKKQVILFGDIPALAYLLDMEPAISSTWPDLDSYSLATLQGQLDKFAVQDSAPPVIIFGRGAIGRIDGTDTLKNKKLVLLREFMQTNGYEECFGNEDYIVYTAEYQQ